MERSLLEKSIKELQSSDKLQINNPPRFSFGTKEVCERMIKETMLGVDKTIKDLEFLPEYHEIADYLSDTKGKGLFLVGSVGRGKSIIAEKVIQVLFHMLHNKIVSVYHASELGSKLKEIVRKKFLVLDDVGIESIYNDFGVKSEPFADIIAMVERNSAIPFITTNLTSKQFMDRYGERTINRIKKQCRIVKFEGKSYRF